MILKNILKTACFLAGISVLFPLTANAMPQQVEAQQVYKKELNIVYLHGMGTTTCTIQLLSDWVTRKLNNYAYAYERAHPDTKVVLNSMIRCYPGYTDIKTWAMNVAKSIDEHFQGKDNIILVGHSMGGKTALYTVANNIWGMRDRVAAVVTINSPVKNLGQFYPPGGGPSLDYCRTGLLGSDEGVCETVINYDSSADGKWVAENLHWLAFISAENAPFSPRFDRTGVDAWPRNMDDGIVPLSAQFADGADVVYYGEYGHSELGVSDVVAETIADNILRYIFGGQIECSIPAVSGTLAHEADWLLGEDVWTDEVGQLVAASGTIIHKNTSLTRGQEWTDVVGVSDAPSPRSDSLIRQLSLPVLTRISEASWFDLTNQLDCRLSIRTRAAPLSTVTAQWVIYRRPLLPEGEKRSYFDVSVKDGTPLTTVTQINWSRQNNRDLGLKIRSTAQSPFRWFHAEWRVYKVENRVVRVIDDIPKS